MKPDENTPETPKERVRPGPPTSQIREIYVKQMGNFTETARALNISRRTLQKWRKKDSDLREELASADEGMKDFAEGQLVVLMRGIPKIEDVVVKDDDGNIVKVVERFTGWKVSPNLGAIQTYLNAHAKDRGYGYSKFGFDGDSDLDVKITRKVVGREETQVD